MDRAAGICSAGEIGFFSMLPSVRKELVLIDHSYRSLSIAMMKYLLLHNHGWRDVVRLLSTDGAATELKLAIDKLTKDLPKEVKTTNNLAQFVQAHNNMVGYGLRELWNSIPQYVLKRANEKLNIVNFAHGDLTDLIKMGPFDLLYISNAFGHSGRSMRAPLEDDLKKVVRPGGYIIEAASAGQKDRWPKIAEQRSTISTMWLYRLYQT